LELRTSRALFIIAALAISFLRVGDAAKESRETAEASGAETDSSMRVGIKTLWDDKVLRTLSVALLIIAAVYLPTEAVVLPTYFEDVDNPSGLGFVISALAAGSAVGSFGYGWISARMKRKTLIRLILLGSAVSIIPMAFLPPLSVLMLAGFLLGLSWGPYSPLISTLVQQRVPAHLQGRVFGVQTAFFYAAPPLGMVLAGLSVESYGIKATYIVLAGVLSVTSILVLLTKALRSNF
jgi:MFS family permease